METETQDGLRCQPRWPTRPQIESTTETHDDRRLAADQEARRRAKVKTSGAGKSQFSSFILFASVIILINLCSFQVDDVPGPGQVVPPPAQTQTQTATTTISLNGADPRHKWGPAAAKNYLTYLESCLEFARMMFTQPMRLHGRTTRYTLAEARVLGKMAKVWYIKKKIKKLSKKLKKHTIAVPVFTAIPIYEHSYYPQPHVTHVSHAGHHAAASSYAPTAVAQLAAAASGGPLSASAAGQQQQLAASASSQHQVAYRMSPPQQARGAMYHPAASHHHIINAYAPSPPLYVDDNGGLYGHYGNAYGRYDGGYHVW